MKRFIVLCSCLSAGWMAYGQNLDEVYSYGFDEYIEKCLDLPVVREISGGTVFRVKYEGNWTNEMKGAFEYACKIWEEQLPTSLPFDITAKIGNIRASGGQKPLSKMEIGSYQWEDQYGHLYTCLPTQVKYVVFSEYMRGYQERFIYDVDSAFFTKPDFEITYNEDMLDEFSFSLYSTPVNKYDFVTVALRDIARGLGFYWKFPANVVNKTLTVDESRCTPFEQAVNRHLSSDPFDAYKDATQGQIHLGNNMLLYAPPVWQNGISLNTFVAKSNYKITELLSYNFGKGSVIRDISDDYSDLLENFLDWNMSDYPTGDGVNQNSSVPASTSNLIEYNGVLDLTDAINTLQEQNGTSTIAESVNIPYNMTSFSINDYCEPYDHNYRPGGFLTREGVSVALLKKDGTWDIISQIIPPIPTDLKIELDKLNINDDANDYARTCDGYLRCRINRCNLNIIHVGNGYKELRLMKTRYYVLDYLPQRTELKFSGIMPAVSTRVSANEYMRDIKIGIKNLEGTERILVEQLDEGDRVPSVFEVNDFKKGYFVATVDKEFYSKFTIIAYNKNGSVRSETLEIAPLEPTESNFEVQMFRDEIQIKDTRSRSKSKHLLVSYEILPLDGYMLRPLLKGKVESPSPIIQIGSLRKGTYVLNYYDIRGQKYSAKFQRQ